MSCSDAISHENKITSYQQRFAGLAFCSTLCLSSTHHEVPGSVLTSAYPTSSLVTHKNTQPSPIISSLVQQMAAPEKSSPAHKTCDGVPIMNTRDMDPKGGLVALRGGLFKRT